ncbi:hypothetical protein Pint_36091 [Pistacia integerrima]|uniref:Uncharacterized protein n=1 Tax=Pistacia integerrima TaxID=434235 RepID=A0ACC0Y2L3_9ROSI|nr:hypothetical protein Pint_36091 [Pistacia integerrima]
MSWILGSIEPHLIHSLHPHRSVKAMWNYLKQVYNQDNNAKRFQIELAIANYTQGDLSVQDYNSSFLTLWNDYSDLVTAKVSTNRLELRLDFESICASLVNRDHVPTLEACFGELLRKWKGCDMSTTQCYSCKKYDHIIPNYPQKFCNYCKQPGHIIKDCTILPSRSNKVYHVVVTGDL